MDGFLFIDKPIGMTSHDVVAKVKRKLKVDKIGHTGTLDPFASGLLILCLGKATKLAYLFSELDKDYEGSIIFGKHYDTYDVTGKVLKQEHPSLHEANIRQMMQTFIGGYKQVPPMYSALKIDGQKLYDIARRGDEIDRDPRDVKIDLFELTSVYQNQMISFRSSVSKGTYIRSLAVDLAAKLGTYGALSSLRRTRVGNYDLSISKKIEDVSLNDIYSLDSYFKNTQSIILNDYMIKLVRNGVYLDERQIKTKEPFIVKDENENMIAYYTINEGYTYRPVVIL